MQENDKPIRLGLVLSGGMAKGAYQIGFCKALSENAHFEVKAISAASIGTLNGYAFAAGRSAQAEEIWRSLDFKGCKKMYDKLLKSGGIMSIAESIHGSSDELKCFLSTVCWSAGEKKAQYIRLDKTPPKYRAGFLKASVAVPPIMHSVTVNGKSYYDGAAADNTPIRPLLKMRELDMILALQFDGYISKKSNDRGVPIMYVNLQEKPIFSDSFDLQRDSVAKMIEYGYREGRGILERLEKSENISAEIVRANAALKENRRTGDHIVRRLNRLTKIISEREMAE